MKRLIWTSVLALGLAMGAAACDDSSGGSNANVPPISTDTTKPLSEVTTAEAKTWCEKYKAEMGNVMSTETQCELAGLGVSAMTGTLDPAACEAAKKACIANPSQYLDSDSSGSSDMDCDSLATEDMKDCDATVAEFDSCMDAMMSETQSVTDKISCSMSLEQLMSLQSLSGLSPDKIPACAPLMEKCPQIFDDSASNQDAVEQNTDVVTVD